ncbi:hypothetical protein GQ53DRAFT_673350 [Thozetella sp. PMI_491]|nr:hypothetical protein GQ53DRAFT_673350 [Thozetella sp. PMI_491]
MYPHHSEAIEKVTEYFRADPEVQALLLSGSIAHGFESETSDIDILIVVSEDDYQGRIQSGRLGFYSKDSALCDYPGGYVDGKYLSLNFIRDVGERGSEPARFAFEGVRVLFNRAEVGDTAHEGGAGGARPLAEALALAVAYPKDGKAARVSRFYAQFEAWKWFAGEAHAKGDRYLLGVAVQKLVLFGGRLILTHNELLYPYHKWFVRMLELAPEKPEGLELALRQAVEDPTKENVESFYQLVKDFRTWDENPNYWPLHFMKDSELGWMDGTVSIEDL